MTPDDHLVLIDASGYIYRAFWALPALERPSDGLPVNAVVGFAQTLWRWVKRGDYTHIVAIFDAGPMTFRHEIFPAYKGNRSGPPAQLIPQFAYIRKATDAFGIERVELEGYEADDLIATYARLANSEGAKVTIVSSDKDFAQLVSDAGVSIFDPIKKPIKKRELGEPEVFEKFQVWPSQMVDYQALVGDQSDNVPGCPGVGAKTAAGLLLEHGTLVKVMAAASEAQANGTVSKLQTRLLHHIEQIRMSWRLVTLDAHVPVPVALEDFERVEFHPGRAITFLREIESVTLLREIEEASGVSA